MSRARLLITLTVLGCGCAVVAEPCGTSARCAPSSSASRTREPAWTANVVTEGGRHGLVVVGNL